nr:GH10 xylanase [uncultured bacterium]
MNAMLTLAAALAVTAMCAAEPQVPAGGQVLVAGEPSPDWTGRYEQGYSEVAQVQGPGFSRAVRVTTAERTAPWNVQFRVPVNAPVAKGDVLLLEFWARCLRTEDESGQGYIRACVEKRDRPWTKSLERTVTVGYRWQRFLLPCTCREDYGPGGLYLAFGTGQVPQVIEIGGIRLISYDKRLSADDLPRTRVTYAGREPDAAWRKEAFERIERIRTAPLVVRVVDEAGRAVAGAKVQVTMVQPAFQFGCAVPAWTIADQQDPSNARRRQAFLELFNAGSFVNALKWPPWVGDWGKRFSREVVFTALNWFKEHDLHFRGHVLIWPGWRHLPRFMRAYRGHPDPQVIRREVLKHIDDITTATRGYVEEWDVINEPYHNHDLMDICGRDLLVECFKRARHNLPDARLALNDFGILTALTDDAHQAHYEQTIQYLLDNGAPLTVLGMQGHFGGTVPPPARMLKVLDRYARFGLPIRITEFTVGTDDEQLRADFLRDALIVAYSHPAVIGFQFWGLGTLFDREMRPRPALAAYKDLVLGRWRTRLEGRTDPMGRFAGRGHLGRYNVKATLNGRLAEGTLELTRAGQAAELTLPLR